MNRLLTLLACCLLFVPVSAQIFIEDCPPDVSYDVVIEQPNPDQPSYNVVLNTTPGGINNIKTMILRVELLGNLNSLDESSIYSGFPQSYLSKNLGPSSGYVQIQFINANPLESISNGNQTNFIMFSFSFTADVSECIDLEIYSPSTILIDGGDFIYICDPQSTNTDQFCFGGLSLGGRIESVPPMQCAGSINHAIRNVDVSLNAFFSSGTQNCISITDEYGDYSCEVLPEHLYKITPNKQDNVACGITSFDYYLLLNHFTGQVPFTTHKQLFLADVNQDGLLAITDLIEIQKVLLGIPVEFSSWRFGPTRLYAALADPPPSGNNVPFFPDFELSTATQNQDNIDFVGFKLGDINESCSDCEGEELRERSYSKAKYPLVNVYIDNQALKSGEETILEVFLPQLNQTSLLNMGLWLDPEWLEIEEVLLGGLPGQNFNDFNLTEIDKGSIRHFWFSPQGLSDLAANTIAFRIRVRAKDDIQDLASFLQLDQRMENQIYQESDLISSLSLNVPAKNEVLNYPNPFLNKTTFQFVLEESQNVEILIHNNAGQAITRHQKWYPKGLNEWQWNAKAIEAKGILFYQIKTKNTILSGKILKL